MKIRAQGVFPVAIIGLLAALTMWLENATRVEVVQADGKTRHDPDFFVDNFSVQRFDEKGVLRATVGAAHMKHFGDTEQTEMSLPDIVFIPEGQPPTRIRANRGTINKDGTQADLEEDVRIDRLAKIPAEQTHMSTAALSVFPDDSKARTDAAVTITQGRSWLSGVGMEVDHLSGSFALHSAVRSRFAPAGGAPR